MEVKQVKVNIQGDSDLLLKENEVMICGMDMTLKTFKADTLQDVLIASHNQMFISCFLYDDKIFLISRNKDYISLHQTQDLENTNEIVKIENKNQKILWTGDHVVLFKDQMLDIISLQSYKVCSIQEFGLKNTFDNNLYFFRNSQIIICEWNENEQIMNEKQTIDFEYPVDQLKVFPCCLLIKSKNEIFKICENKIDNLTELLKGETCEQIIISKSPSNLVLLQRADKTEVFDLEQMKCVLIIDIQLSIITFIEYNESLLILTKQGNLIQYPKQHKEIIEDMIIQKRRVQIDGDIDEFLDNFEVEKKEEQKSEDKVEEKEIKSEEEKDEKKEEDFIVDDEEEEEKQIVSQNYQQRKEKEEIIMDLCDTYPQFQFISGQVDKNRQKRYIKVNGKGKIVSYPELNQIQIEYADINVYQKEIINNEQNNFNLGDLHEKAFILAYSGKATTLDEYEDEENEEDYESILYFKATDSDNEWQITFDNNIVLKQVCLSSLYVFAITDDDEIKVFNYGGIEIYNFQAGNIITTAAFEQFISIVCSNSLPVNGKQNLTVETYNMNNFLKSGEMKLNLTKQSCLLFFDYSDDGVLYSQDDKGVIRMEVGGQYWINIYRPKKDSKFFWIYSVIDKKLIGYLLKNTQQMPDPLENYQVYKITPKCVSKSVLSEDEDQVDLIYRAADYLNERLKFLNFQNIKETKTENVFVKMFQEKILNEQEQVRMLEEEDKKQLRFIGKLVCEEKYYAALFQLFQIKTESCFQKGIQYFEQMNLKKLTKILKEIIRERGTMIHLNVEETQLPKQKPIVKKVNEKFEQYFEESEKKSDFTQIHQKLKEESQQVNEVSQPKYKEKIIKKEPSTQTDLMKILGNANVKKIKQLSK